jgi:hypothetical protein
MSEPKRFSLNRADGLIQENKDGGFIYYEEFLLKTRDYNERLENLQWALNEMENRTNHLIDQGEQLVEELKMMSTNNNLIQDWITIKKHALDFTENLLSKTK